MFSRLLSQEDRWHAHCFSGALMGFTGIDRSPRATRPDGEQERW
jgi:hypothetical protein